jgi:hypothetical protein
MARSIRNGAHLHSPPGAGTAAGQNSSQFHWTPNRALPDVRRRPRRSKIAFSPAAAADCLTHAVVIVARRGHGREQKCCRARIHPRQAPIPSGPATHVAELILMRKNIETAPTEKTQTEGERNGSKMTLKPRRSGECRSHRNRAWCHGWRHAHDACIGTTRRNTCNAVHSY